jgi:hypothetical protein
MVQIPSAKLFDKLLRPQFQPPAGLSTYIDATFSMTDINQKKP